MLFRMIIFHLKFIRKKLKVLVWFSIHEDRPFFPMIYPIIGDVNNQLLRYWYFQYHNSTNILILSTSNLFNIAPLNGRVWYK